MSTMTASREWVPFKKRTIGKGRGFMTPHETTLKVLFLGKNMYMSKKVLRTLGNPLYINLSQPDGEDVCLLTFDNDTEGYKVHGLNGGTGASAYVDINAFIKEFNVRDGLYPCHIENGQVVFNMREYTPMARQRRNSKH